MRPVPGGPGSRTGRDMAGSFQRKKPFSRVPSGGLGMMLTRKGAGPLQGGLKVLPEEDMRTSPGPGSVWARERRTLCCSIEKGGCPAKGLRDTGLKAQQVRSQSELIYILRTSRAPFCIMTALFHCAG